MIPDFLPGVGASDDALVLAYAYKEGADGIERYRAWRELQARPGGRSARAASPTSRTAPPARRPKAPRGPRSR